MFIEFFQYGFLQRALITGILVAIVCAIIGVFLVLRQMSLLGDGLAHIAFGGIALGLLMDVYPLLIALGFTILSAFAIQHLKERAKIFGDTAIAILFAAGLAMGVILLSLSGGFNVDILSYLFGSILTVSRADLLMISILAVVVPTIVIVLYKEFFAITFDEESARVSGLPVRKLNLVFTILTAITVVLAMRVVGILLVSSLIVLPAATSMQLAKSFKQTFFFSIIVAILMVVLGMFTSYAFNLAPSGTIVLSGILLFLLSISGGRGDKH